MSYDMMVFEASVAPREAAAFIAWFEKQAQWGESHEYDDPAVSSPALTWWISTRRRPQCNWPRLLLDDELYESERASLALTHDEVVSVLHHLPPDQAERVAARIIQRTGGWCAGARMALLQKCDWSQNLQPQQRVDTLLDYLQHELFSNLTPEQDEAWRVLAHLPRFNAPLCEHLFGAGVEGVDHPAQVGGGNELFVGRKLHFAVQGMDVSASHRNTLRCSC